MTFLRSLFTSSAAKKAKKDKAALAASTTTALLAWSNGENARLEEVIAAQDAHKDVAAWASEQREAHLQAQIDLLLLVADKRAERARYYLGRAQQYRRTAAREDEEKGMMDETERQEQIELEKDLGSVERKFFLHSIITTIHSPITTSNCFIF